VQQQAQLEAIAKGGLQALAAAAAKGDQPCSFSNVPQTTPGAIGIKARGQSIELMTLLLTQLMGRPVVDKSGLKGLYDFELTIDLQTILRIYAELGINNIPGLPANLPEGPSLMTTLQEDLGLKLDSRRGPGEVLVIDSAELPTPD
jgi:uncharacterized protein (TIGR03435 family)